MPNPILDHMQVTGTDYDIKDASAVHTVDGEAPDQYGNVNAGKVYVANEFSTSTSYTIGQYVIYEQKLYKFIADHTAGAWNSAHVEQKKLANVVSDLSNVVDEFGITIQTTDWSNSSPYTYTYTDARILQQSSVDVAYTNNSTDTTAFWIDYEVPVGGGGIVFTADDKPTGSIGVCVKILNTEATLSIQSRAEDISTEAVSGAENVEEALSTLNSRVGANTVAVTTVQGQVSEIIVRGRKDIRNSLTNLPTAISEQNLEKYGYQVGDYFDASGFTGASGYRYTLADMDTFYGGYSASGVVSTHHITLLVDTNTNVKWNTSNDTSTGYVGSNLHSYLVNTVLPNVKTDIVALFGGAWSDHLISHQKLYSTGTESWAWSSGQYISAPTSVQWHGSPICDMNFYHTGEGNKPLEVFQRYFYPEIMGNQNNWLRSVASASCPAFASNVGYASGAGVASAGCGAVGLIIFH